MPTGHARTCDRGAEDHAVCRGPDRGDAAEGTIPAGLRLIDSTVSSTGVVIGTYQPAGELVTGSFALE